MPNKFRFLLPILLLAVFLTGLFLLPQPYWAVLTALLAAWVMWEWGGLADLNTGARGVLGGIALALAVGLMVFFPETLLSVAPSGEEQRVEYKMFVWAAWDFGGWFYGPAVLFWCLLAPTWVKRQWRLGRGRWGKALSSILGLGLILTTWLALVQMRAYDAGLLIFCCWFAALMRLALPAGLVKALLSPQADSARPAPLLEGAAILMPLLHFFSVLLLLLEVQMPD
ncbi:MAG: hypothetical protein LBS89_07480 [Zoogloeaceae bacterium]|jgi:phosphatidate cytidylyltransferase|nr:hypothetical protein [Zoogloeaceae bacterium]